MYIARMEEEIVDRGSSRGFHGFPKPVRFTGLVHIISQYTPIKHSRFMDSISNKAVVTQFITSIYMLTFVYQS